MILEHRERIHSFTVPAIEIDLAKLSENCKKSMIALSLSYLLENDCLGSLWIWHTLQNTKSMKESQKLRFISIKMMIWSSFYRSDASNIHATCFLFGCSSDRLDDNNFIFILCLLSIDSKYRNHWVSSVIQQHFLSFLAYLFLSL